MYREYWGLAQAPFSEAHHASLFVPTAQYELVRAKVEYLMGQGQGAAALCGEAGVGKSAYAWELLRGFARAGAATSYIVTPFGGAPGMLASIAHDLDGTGDTPIEAIVNALERFQAEQRHACLVIDEVHTIADLSILETLRLLLNVEIHGELPLTLLLVGQPPMKRMLRRASSFDQRLSFLMDLRPMDEEETKQYVLARLKNAGCRRGIFTKAAAERICEHSRGIPRQVNRICDLALLTGCGLGHDKIRPEVIDEVVASLPLPGNGEEEAPLSPPASVPELMTGPTTGTVPDSVAGPQSQPQPQPVPVTAPVKDAAPDIMASVMSGREPEEPEEDILSGMSAAPSGRRDVLAELAGTPSGAEAPPPEPPAPKMPPASKKPPLAPLAGIAPDPIPPVARKAASAPIPEPAPPSKATRVAPREAAVPASPRPSAPAPVPVSVPAHLPEEGIDQALFDQDAETEFDSEVIVPPEADVLERKTEEVSGIPAAPSRPDGTPGGSTSALADLAAAVLESPEENVSSADDSDDILTKALFGGLDGNSDESGNDDLASLFGNVSQKKDGGGKKGASPSKDDDLDDVFKELGL